MSERTYGIDGYSISDIRPDKGFDTIPCDLAVHIRELEAENATLRGQVRDNLAVAEAVRNAAMVALGDEKSHLVVAGHIKQLDLPAIVEQELNK